MNACNSINAQQKNKPVGKWDIVKFHQINIRPNKVPITNSY